jgi:hypothetical protein
MTTDTNDAIHPNDFRAQTTQVLLRRLWRDVSALGLLDAELARHELAEKTQAAGRVASAFLLSAAFAAAALLSITICIVAAAGTTIGIPLAALILTLLYVLTAIAFAIVGRRAYARAGGMALPKTTHELLGWLKADQPRDLSQAELEHRIEWTHQRIDESVMALERKSDLLPPLRDTAMSVGSLGVALAALLRDKRANGR